MIRMLTMQVLHLQESPFKSALIAILVTLSFVPTVVNTTGVNTTEVNTPESIDDILTTTGVYDTGSDILTTTTGENAPGSDETIQTTTEVNAPGTDENTINTTELNSPGIHTNIQTTTGANVSGTDKTNQTTTVVNTPASDKTIRTTAGVKAQGSNETIQTTTGVNASGTYTAIQTTTGVNASGTYTAIQTTTGVNTSKSDKTIQTTSGGHALGTDKTILPSTGSGVNGTGSDKPIQTITGVNPPGSGTTIQTITGVKASGSGQTIQTTTGVNNPGTDEDIHCSANRTSCVFTFQCSTYSCVLSDRNPKVNNIAVDFPRGRSVHQIVDDTGILISWNTAALSNISQDAFEELQGAYELYLSVLNLDQNRVVEIINLENLNVTNSTVEIHLGSFSGLINVNDLRLEDNRISRILPGSFNGFTNVLSLRLDHNSLADIPPGSFSGLINLEILRLDHNIVDEIGSRSFDTLVKLQALYLDHNKVVQIDPESFDGLVSLRFLYLRENNIVEIHPNLFHGLVIDSSTQSLEHNSTDGLTQLRILHLEHNRIAEIHHETFQYFTDLKSLYLHFNNIEMIDWQMFRSLYDLSILDLHNNRIAVMHDAPIESLAFLEYLDLSRNNLVKLILPLTVMFSKLKYFSLSHNTLSSIQNGALQHMPNLQYLDLFGNNFNNFDSFSYFKNAIGPIKILDLRKSNLRSVNADSFKGFDTHTTIIIDYEATCCFVPRAECRGTIPRSQFLTCGRLIPNIFQRIIMWFLGLFSLFANIGSLCYRYVNRHRQENTIQVLLISNLSLSDMLMGIYMIIVASADLYYRDYFPSEAWRLSLTCKIAGALSMISSEASVLFVTMISIDRFMGIRYTFSTYRFSTKSSKVISVLLWAISFVLSVVSSIIPGINPDWYDVSEVCTGLPLSNKNVYGRRLENYKVDIHNPESKNQFVFNKTYDIVIDRAPGMYYGIAVFTVLNSICFLTVLICYLDIFVTVIQTSKRAGRARNLTEERKMAAKMGVIVITDLACWAPVIILSILVQSGRHVIEPHVYTWIVTFVLPINSAVNPFLYTLASLIFDFINEYQNRVQPIHI